MGSPSGGGGSGLGPAGGQDGGTVAAVALAAQQQAIQIQAQIQAMQLQNQMMLNGLGAGQTQAGGAPGQVGGGRVMGMGMNPATMTGNYGPAAAAAAAAGGFSSPCRLRIRLLEEMLNLSFLFAFSPCLSAAAANNQTGRTVYVGNLPPEASVDELLNLVRFGPIESVRLLPEKSCVFISFLDGSTAAAFHADASVKKLALHGQELKIGWGKPSNVPAPVAIAIQQHRATRNVYLGGLEEETTEQGLRDDLSRFGPIDQVKIVRDKNIGFVHFLTISTAQKVSLTFVLLLSSKLTLPCAFLYSRSSTCFLTNLSGPVSESTTARIDVLTCSFLPLLSPLALFHPELRVDLLPSLSLPALKLNKPPSRPPKLKPKPPLVSRSPTPPS
jgi:hypothetical protein